MNGFTVSGKVKRIMEGSSGRRTLVVSQPPGKDKDGMEVEREVHFELWGRSADVAKELSVGQPVLVAGTITSKPWQEKFITKPQVDVLFATGAAPERGAATHREERAPEPPPSDDDLPF